MESLRRSSIRKLARAICRALSTLLMAARAIWRALAALRWHDVTMAMRRALSARRKAAWAMRPALVALRLAKLAADSRLNFENVFRI